MGAVFRFVFVWLALILGSGESATAAPRISEVMEYYTVNGTSARALRNEMSRKGPRRFWAYTRWEVRWSAACQVSVRVVYTMPRHENLDALSPQLRRSLIRMFERLEAHERLHGANGINAAREIKDANCRKARKIIRKYNRADRELDRRTDHGRKQGVVLE